MAFITWSIVRASSRMFALVAIRRMSAGVVARNLAMLLILSGRCRSKCVIQAANPTSRKLWSRLSDDLGSKSGSISMWRGPSGSSSASMSDPEEDSESALGERRPSCVGGKEPRMPRNSRALQVWPECLPHGSPHTKQMASDGWLAVQLGPQPLGAGGL